MHIYTYIKLISHNKYIFKTCQDQKDLFKYNQKGCYCIGEAQNKFKKLYNQIILCFYHLKLLAIIEANNYFNL